MKSLNLTPAESLIIISPGSNGFEMIKLTLMDLLLKKALKIYREDPESRFLKRQTTVFISNGELENLILKPHEQLLVDMVNNNEFELKEFAKILLKSVSSTDYKNLYIREPLINNGYFKKQRKMLLALVPYNAYILTEKGNEVKSIIMTILDEAEYLGKWMREDLGMAKAYLSVVGSHILLVNDYDLEDIKKFNKILSTLKPEAKTSDYYNYYLYTIPFDYIDEYGNLKSFDFLDIDILNNFDVLDDFFSEFDLISDTVADVSSGD
ncbi:hypothetical protein [Methanobacterium sp. ACI-7]|uniref:hypothetical protein n=1 Tax=unclassified Methanobacterium TaxID=2627676 RepID=UPI0039C4AA69